MNILEKLEVIENEYNILNESGIRNIKLLAKTHKNAEIYFHIDLDGVTSAIGMKNYLKQYGIKTVDVHPIQYGGKEFEVPKPTNKTLAVMVDFAHGKPTMHIHTDHHEGQVGVSKGTSTSFVKTPSNAAYISQVLSPNDIFPPKDSKIINTVDSADFSSQGITPDEILRAVFGIDNNKSVEKNHRAMGFAVNKLLLSYKNKPNFLEQLVLKANPSLISMYNVIKKLIQELGLKAPKDVEMGTYDYVQAQKEKGLPNGKPSDVKNLKSGQSIKVGSTLFQYGGGSMIKGYDRYTPFKNNPDIDYFSIIWPVGLIQLSQNPFKSGTNQYHLGDLVMKQVMPKFKSKLNKEITLDTVKWMFERDIKKKGLEKAVGFTFSDLMALFGDKVKNVGEEGSSWRDIIKDITDTPNDKLSFKQKNLMKKVKLNVWDIIMSQSGGHKAITNLSGFNFYGKGYVDLMKEIQSEIAKVMQNKKLQESIWLHEINYEV